MPVPQIRSFDSSRLPTYTTCDRMSPFSQHKRVKRAVRGSPDPHIPDQRAHSIGEVGRPATSARTGETLPIRRNFSIWRNLRTIYRGQGDNAHMAKSTSVMLSISLLAALVSGCCSIDQVYHPTGSCGDGWDPVFGSCHDCGGDTGCNEHSPCQDARHMLTCASGCGEIYWGEWLSDPPDPCDPCDGCGNWIGPRCCPPPWWAAFKCGAPGWWGWRCGPSASCCDGSGCDSCMEGDESDVWEGTEILNGPEVLEEIPPGAQQPQPRLVPQPPTDSPPAVSMEQQPPPRTPVPPIMGGQAAARRPVRSPTPKAAPRSTPSQSVLRPTRHTHPHPMPAKAPQTRPVRVLPASEASSATSVRR